MQVVAILIVKHSILNVLFFSYLECGISNDGRTCTFHDIHFIAFQLSGGRKKCPSMFWGIKINSIKKRKTSQRVTKACLEAWKHADNNFAQDIRLTVLEWLVILHILYQIFFNFLICLVTSRTYTGYAPLSTFKHI